MSAIGIQDLYEDILVRTRNNSIDEQQNYVQYINDDIKNGKNHRLNTTRSKSSSKKDYAHEKPFLITHVTLALDDVNNDPSYPVPTWRYNSIRRNPSSSSNYNFHNSNRLINHPNRKYFQKSFFLTGLSDEIETQQRNTNNENEQRNRIEQKRTKSIKRQNNDLEQNSSTHSSENEIDDQHIQHISPVNTKTHHSSAHNINSASVNSSIISSSNKQRDNRPKFKGENFFIDLSRARTSLGEASIASNETGRISGRNSGRNSYTVAEFNRFKNSLLKNHSKNDLNRNASQSSVYKSQQIPQSTIKSIYEAVERENRSKNYSVDVKRSNYLKSLKKTEALLASSLVIKKLN